jgi:hypothetical protein
MGHAIEFTMGGSDEYVDSVVKCDCASGKGQEFRRYLLWKGSDSSRKFHCVGPRRKRDDTQQDEQKIGQQSKNAYSSDMLTTMQQILSNAYNPDRYHRRDRSQSIQTSKQGRGRLKVIVVERLSIVMTIRLIV